MKLENASIGTSAQEEPSLPKTPKEPQRVSNLIAFTAGIAVGAGGLSVLRSINPGNHDSGVFSNLHRIIESDSIEKENNEIVKQTWKKVISTIPEAAPYQSGLDEKIDSLLFKSTSNTSGEISQGSLNSRGEVAINWLMIEAAAKTFEALGVGRNESYATAALLAMPTLVHELSHNLDNKAVAAITGHNGFHRALESEILARFAGARTAKALAEFPIRLNQQEITLGTVAPLIPIYGDEFSKALELFLSSPDSIRSHLLTFTTYSQYIEILRDTPFHMATKLSSPTSSEKALLHDLEDPALLERIRNVYRSRLDEVGGTQAIVKRERDWQSARLRLAKDYYSIFSGQAVLDAWGLLNQFPPQEHARRLAEFKESSAGLVDLYFEQEKSLPEIVPANAIEAALILREVHGINPARLLASFERIRDGYARRIEHAKRNSAMYYGEREMDELRHNQETAKLAIEVLLKTVTSNTTEVNW